MQRRQPARSLGLLLLWAGVAAGLLLVLSRPPGDLVPLGVLLDPADGLYYTARSADNPSNQTLELPGLEGEVSIIRDDHGVPHIFAETDLDAITALGYLTAKDRLFQVDLQVRMAAGRLAEIFGPEVLDTDRFLRSLGLRRGARLNAERIKEEAGLELTLAEAYLRGFNAYVENLDERSLPLEMRLLGYRPERFSLESIFLINQSMAFDLTYPIEPAAEYALVRDALGEEVFETLYPQYSRLFVPIIPEEGGVVVDPEDRDFAEVPSEAMEDAQRILRAHHRQQETLFGPAEGYVEGKGSNNWAVMGELSKTGGALFAGDPHLRLSLPAIWYQVHLVTPNMNVYGVAIPGAILPVMGFNEHVAWSSTNTGADVIDHYVLELNEEMTAYRFEDGYREFERVPDTIFVQGEEPVVDTLRFSRWGPVLFDEERTAGRGAVAIKWTAHRETRTLEALWEMNQARNALEFDEALRYWGTPMQNWLAADVEGNIAIRAAGYLPIRRGGHGIGLLDGSSDTFAWTGRVPFEELPHSFNPDQGFLASANQEPADSSYEHYLGYNWRDAFRSLRLDSLLRGQDTHGVKDFQRYQSDVVAVHRDLFVPMLDTLSELSVRAETLQEMLSSWDGEMVAERPEPLILHEWIATLESQAWAHPAFREGVRPTLTTLYYFLQGELDGVGWADLSEGETPRFHSASAFLRATIEEAAGRLEDRHGWDPEGWQWGEHNQVVVEHLTRSDALEVLGRGPYPFPGYPETLSPARGTPVVHSASWRNIVDLSQEPPVGYGIHPGGQSGNPFSRFYDHFLPTYLDFGYYELFKPEGPDEIEGERIHSRLTLQPAP